MKLAHQTTLALILIPLLIAATIGLVWRGKRQ
jgi:hypothetical protein